MLESSRLNAAATLPRAGINYSLAAFAFAAAGLWLVLVGYRGINHDSILYSLQALSHLHPELYANDIYLRFGSQDNYTVYAPLMGKLIGAMGMEPASALVTLLSLIALLVAAWRLADLLEDRPLAALGTALLFIVPSTYGSDTAFHVVENFATPRIAAEALVLSAIVAAERGNRGAVLALLAVSLVLHPLITAPGVLFLALRFASPKQLKWAGIAAVAGFVALTASLQLLSVKRLLQFDDFWFAYGCNRLPYLLLSNWSRLDWASVAVPLATLVIGYVEIQDPRIKRFIAATFACGVLGIVLTGLGGDFLRMILVVQGQPWRSLWIVTAVTLLILPRIAQSLLEGGKAGRSVLFALIACWVLRPETYALSLAGLALAAYAAYRSRRLSKDLAAFVYYASVGALVLSVVWSIGNSILAFGKGLTFYNVPFVLIELRGSIGDGVLGAAVLLVLWYTFVRASLSNTVGRLAVTCVAVAALTAPLALDEWRYVQYPDALKQSFSEWREKIPQGTEVLWVTGPAAAWFILERPSYLSSEQSGTALFSRAAAAEMNRRALPLKDFLRSEVSMLPRRYRYEKMDYVAPPPLASVCAAAEVKFVISFQDLGNAVLTRTSPGPYQGLHLYECKPSA